MAIVALLSTLFVGAVLSPSVSLKCSHSSVSYFPGTEMEKYFDKSLFSKKSFGLDVCRNHHVSSLRFLNMTRLNANDSSFEAEIMSLWYAGRLRK